MTTLSPELQKLKARLKATWEAGDYGGFARHLEPGALALLERLRIAPGTRLLDVACGDGQTAIPAARAGAVVTGVDIAANLIAQARERAAAEALDARFDEGDAEALPYGDASFDLVLSLFGAMFAPRPDVVAAELLRVCRAGGRIVMVNWTPAGHVGQQLDAVAKHVRPSSLMPSPLLWGDADTVRKRFGAGARELHVERRGYPMRFPFAPADVVEFFRTHYGPTMRAFDVLDDGGRAALRADLEAVWTRNNVARDGTTHVDAECLEVTVIRR